MKEFTYEQFLQDKIKDQHTLTHLLQQDIDSQKQRIINLVKDLAIVRRSENDLKLRTRQMQQKMVELQMQNKKLKQNKHLKIKEISQKRIKQQKANEIDQKQIFKMYIDNTFPKYKGIIKKFMKMVYVIEDTERKEPLQKIKFYHILIENIVKRFLDWIFPKRKVGQNKKQLAENLVSEWKKQEKQQQISLTKTNVTILKEAAYIKQIQDLEAQILMLRSNINQMEGRMRTYERSMQAKGAEFVAHLRKVINNTPDIEPQSQAKVEQTIELFTTIINLSKIKNQEQLQEKSILNQVPLILTDTKTQAISTISKRKAAPILKKNIFGYYQQPQFAGNYTLTTPTKHTNNNKYTQTLSEDLCILTLHPVIMVTLIDGNIKPQRTKINLQHYVKIRINDERNVDSIVKEGLEPIWNQPFLLKDYDFPFIGVQLMHKSKGLRDYALGGGKFSASSQQQKIVNVRKEKEFMGRVRFSLSYPKGNIFEFKITSVLLQVPEIKNVLKEQVQISFPYNQIINLEFILPEKIQYIQKSVIILQNCEEDIVVKLPKQDLLQKIALRQFAVKEGNKEIIIQLQQFKVIIQGEIYLLICEDQQPERISEQLLEGGKGKYFSVRAPPPIVTVTYHQITLHSNIKFPLVFKLEDICNVLSIVKELSNRELQQDRVNQIVNQTGQLKLNEIIKAPSKIYKMFVESLEGQPVYFQHQSHLFERLLKQIHLRVSYKEDEIQEINYAKKGKKQKQLDSFKEFTIESKELMLNHFKIFTRHFKRIGFIKFKLGYTIYDNELLNEEATVAKVQEIPPLKQGLYFVELQLTSAHLNTKSSSSQYSCKINQSSITKKIKGNHPIWKQTFTFQFQLKQKFQFTLDYQIVEHGVFGDKIAYTGQLIINQDVIDIGVAIINLNPSCQDCLHFASIKIPSEVFHLGIESIEGQIQQQADWIGKIDPYIKLFSKNRQILKTNALDNIGSHPVWSNINQHFFISRNENNSQIQQIVNCKVYDYDIIGRDDYIGEVLFDTKLNYDLVRDGKSLTLYGNIVKQNKICGGMKLRGKFQKIKQQKLIVKKDMVPKLSKKDIVYKLTVYNFTFNKLKEFEGDNGWINCKIEDKMRAKYQMEMQQQAIKQFNLVKWGYKSESLSFQIQRQYKSFFKKEIINVGSFDITIRTQKQFGYGCAKIFNEHKEEAGSCNWFIQFQNKIKYSIISKQLNCQHQIKIISDLRDQITFYQQTQTQMHPQLLFYQNNLFLTTTYHQKLVTIQQSQFTKGVSQFVYPLQDHQDPIAYLKIQKTLLYQTSFEQSSQKCKKQYDRQFKSISYLHWQPYKFKEQIEYKFIINFKDSNQNYDFVQKTNHVYNDYLLLQKMSVPIIFDGKNPPNSIKIINLVNNEEQIVTLKENTTKIFIPNKGALYYQFQDFNQKSVLEIHFQYLYLRVKNTQICNNYQDVRIKLYTYSSSKLFTCSPVFGKECFLFENINLFIGQPSNSGTFFFEGFIEGKKSESNQFEKILMVKFGLKQQHNKQQYRFSQTSEFIIHSHFSSSLIQRQYQISKPIDNTMYGMSFIQLKGIQFEVNEDPSNKQVYIQLQLNNQHQKVLLERLKDSYLWKAETDTVFFIEKYVQATMTIIEEGILSKNILGITNFEITQTNIIKQDVHIHCEVKKSGTNIGRTSLHYKNIQEIDFIDVNLFSYICKSNDLTMLAELQQFGPNKEKYQQIMLTSKGNVPRLQSQDSFIVLGDTRNYQINVCEKQSKKLLGEFKMYNELKQIGDKVTVLQPLRTSNDSLNGVLIIQYEKKHSNTVTFQQNKENHIQLVKFIVSNLTFKKHSDYLKEDISLNLKTAARNITTKPMPIEKPNSQKSLSFILYNNQYGQLRLFKKTELLGVATVIGPFYHSQERVIVFQLQKKVIGICVLRVQYLTDKSEIIKMRQVCSIEGHNLMDTQYFVKMKPFVEIETSNQERWPIYVSEFGLGKENIYWKLNIISADMLNFIVKDKDMFFDDLIGNALLPHRNSLQKQEQTSDLLLVSTEEDNRKGGNGTLKILTSPIIYNQEDEANIKIIEDKKTNCYLLRLTGISDKYHQKLKRANVLVINLISGNNSFKLHKAKYNKDIMLYLSNKQLQLQFDTSFCDQQHIAISIQFFTDQQLDLEQRLYIKEDNKVKFQQIFQVNQLIPLERKCKSLSKLYIWLYDKIQKEVDIVITTNSSLCKTRLLANQKRLFIIEPVQLINMQDQQIHILFRQNKKNIFNLPIRVNKNKTNTLIGSIVDQKSNQIGYYYAQMQTFYSEGTKEQAKIMIGKSQKQWLVLNISQAFLTKDLQFFSKMDPYCKFAISKQKQNEEQWYQTSVQDNIGLHPIWNESFFVQIHELNKNESIKFIVMDSQVTIDRKIGEGKLTIGNLIEKKNIHQISIYADEKEISGKLIVKTSVTSKYLIIRQIFFGQQEYQINLKHKQNKPKIIIIEGLKYPIDDECPLIFTCEKQQKLFTFKELKTKRQRTISFQQTYVVLTYQIFD